MAELGRYYTDNQTGIAYTLVGDYYLPDLEAPKVIIRAIGRYGRERLNYLKRHRRITYTYLLTSGKLSEHLYEIDETANDRIEYLVRQMANRESVTEKLKAEDMMLWVKTIKKNSKPSNRNCT